MALLILCEGVVTETNQGDLRCDVPWTTTTYVPNNSETLSIEDFQELWAFTIAIFVAAVGIKYLRYVFDDKGGRNA